MYHLEKYKLFERKGNYKLFHKTDKLINILESGYIKGGYKWDVSLRKNVLKNWEYGKYPTISCTRNLNYFWLPALEINVEKVSDNYKIVPYSENPDFYLGHWRWNDDKYANRLKKIAKEDKRKNLSTYQKMLRRGEGKYFWKYKTDKEENDHGIAEELIVTKRLDLKKYIKRIILPKYGYKTEEDIISEKYPYIEVVRISSKNYSEIRKELKNKKEFVKTFEIYRNFSTIVTRKPWNLKDVRSKSVYDLRIVDLLYLKNLEFIKFPVKFDHYKDDPSKYIDDSISEFIANIGKDYYYVDRQGFDYFRYVLKLKDFEDIDTIINSEKFNI